MSRHSKRSVKILNPAPGGHSHTTRRSARRYCDQGRAEWINDSTIAFRSEDRRHQAAIDAAPPLRSHSPALAIVQRSIGEYRNRVLGLPNFVGFIKDRSAHGRAVTTASLR